MEAVLESIDSIALESSMLNIVLEGESEEENPSKIKAMFTKLKETILHFWNDIILPKIKAFGKRLLDLKSRIGNSKIMVNIKKLPIIKKILEKFGKKSNEAGDNVEKEYATTLQTAHGMVTNVPKSALDSVLSTSLEAAFEFDPANVIDVEEEDMKVIDDTKSDTPNNMKDGAGIFKKFLDAISKGFSSVMGKIIKGKEKCVAFVNKAEASNPILEKISHAIKSVMRVVSGAVNWIIAGIQKIFHLFTKVFKKDKPDEPADKTTDEQPKASGQTSLAVI